MRIDYVLVKKQFDGRAHDIVNVIDGVSRAIYSQRSLEQILQEQPDLHTVPYTTYEEMYAQYLNSKVTEPKEISEEEYYKRKGAVPFVGRSCGGVSMGYSSELKEATLADWYAQFGGKFYTFVEQIHADPERLSANVRKTWNLSTLNEEIPCTK